MKSEQLVNSYISKFVENMINDDLPKAKKSLENAIIEKFSNIISEVDQSLNKE